MPEPNLEQQNGFFLVWRKDRVIVLLTNNALVKGGLFFSTAAIGRKHNEGIERGRIMDSTKQSAQSKVGFLEKAAFGLANLGNIPIMTITGSFLLIFYTDIVGLSPAACGTLFLIARIFDGITDPILGFVIDHLPYTKRGHFRPALAVGAVLTSINFLLVFMGPYLASTFKLGIAYITYLLIGVLFDVMDISLNSLLPVMTTDMKERSSLSTIKGMFYMVGVFGINIVAPIIVGSIPGASGYITMIVAFSIIVMLFSLIGAAGVKERVKPQEGGEKYGIKDLWNILKQRPVAVQFICTLLMTTGGYISQTVTLYFYTYILGNVGLLAMISMGSMVAFFPGMLLSGILAPRLGKKFLFVFGLTVGAVSPLLRLLSITNIPLLLVSTILSGLGSGLMMPLNYGMQADNTDYVELAIGHRTEAAVASLNSFLTKFAMGVGGAIPGYLLAWVGYNANLEIQPVAVSNAIIFCICIAPVIFSVAGAAIMATFYPLNKEKLIEQNAEMKKRHEVISAAK